MTEFQGVVEDYADFRIEIAEAVAKAAQNAAPQGRTGDLKRGIRAVAGDPKGSKPAREAGPFEPLFAVSDAFYSSWVEDGTVKMPPRRFMLPAIEAQRNKAR
jgi:HK97 gp10 family phage protein